MAVAIKERLRAARIQYAVADSGDLEAGTHTIVPTSRPAIASAQYTYTGATASSPEIWAIMRRVCARINVNISSLGTATTVYLSVRVDADDADHEIFDTSWASTGSKLAAVDIHSGFKPDVLALLIDGSNHTFYFLFWADVASQAQLTIVEIWYGLGTCNTNDSVSSPPPTVIDVYARGAATLTGYAQRTGTGNIYFAPREYTGRWLNWSGNSTAGSTTTLGTTARGGSAFSVCLVGTVATDLGAITDAVFVLLDQFSSFNWSTYAYAPGTQDTSDLEAATKTVNAVAEAAGVGNADYSSALTITGVPDTRLSIQRIAARLAVTIDSLNAGAAHLYCRVYVDAQDADHRLFDLDLTAPAAQKLNAVDTHSGAYATIFGLLSDGSAHTFYFFFWVDAGNVVISECRLWEGIGSCGTTNTYASPAPSCFLVTSKGHTGESGIYGVYATRTGSGTGSLRWRDNTNLNCLIGALGSITTGSKTQVGAYVSDNSNLAVWGTVATDIVVAEQMLIIFKHQSQEV